MDLITVEQNLSLVSGPTLEPVTVNELKQQLRITASDEDLYLARLISAARLYAETVQRRQFVTATWRLSRDAFPGGPEGYSDAPLELPRPPLVSVSSVSYVDTNGATQVWSSANYNVDAYREPGRIVPAYEQVWPGTRNQANAVTIQFVAGYGATAAAAIAAVPEHTKLGILQLAAHWYEHREPVVLGTIATPVPFHCESLFLMGRWGGYP